MARTDWQHLIAMLGGCLLAVTGTAMLALIEFASPRWSLLLAAIVG